MENSNNILLARWQGWKPNNSACTEWCDMKGYVGDLPDYLNDDAAAMSLLDTLVSKGFIWSLYGQPEGILCKVYKMPDAVWCAKQYGNTRREAVVAACLELIKEDV